MSAGELWDKFEDCAKRSLPRDNIAPLFEMLGKIERIGTIADLSTLLEQHGTTEGGITR
jgi:hypothetical protein